MTVQRIVVLVSPLLNAEIPNVLLRLGYRYAKLLIFPSISALGAAGAPGWRSRAISNLHLTQCNMCHDERGWEPTPLHSQHAAQTTCSSIYPNILLLLISFSISSTHTLGSLELGTVFFFSVICPNPRTLLTLGKY